MSEAEKIFLESENFFLFILDKFFRNLYNIQRFRGERILLLRAFWFSVCVEVRYDH